MLKQPAQGKHRGARELGCLRVCFKVPGQDLDWSSLIHVHMPGANQNGQGDGLLRLARPGLLSLMGAVGQ